MEIVGLRHPMLIRIKIVSSTQMNIIYLVLCHEHGAVGGGGGALNGGLVYTREKENFIIRIYCDFFFLCNVKEDYLDYVKNVNLPFH